MTQSIREGREGAVRSLWKGGYASGEGDLARKGEGRGRNCWEGWEREAGNGGCFKGCFLTVPGGVFVGG